VDLHLGQLYPLGRSPDLKILWRSFGCALTTVLCLVCGYPLAYFIALVAPKYKNLFLILLVIPFWTNFLIRSMPGLPFSRIKDS